MRSPLTAFAGETLPGIGHNNGPSFEPGRRWRAHCWKAARTTLMPKLPLEVIKRRVKRATELGLDYPQYASVLLGSGRDIVAFLFTSNALGLRLEQTLALPAPVAVKVRSLKSCDSLLMVRHGEATPNVTAQLATQHQIYIAALGQAPQDGNPRWRDGRAAIRAILDPLKLPSDAVVMVGTQGVERDWAGAARLAKFLPAENYFPNCGSAG